MKHLLLLFLFVPWLCMAGEPDGYYTNAANKSGAELKAALYNIIKGHTTYPYTSTSTDVWDILKLTDRDPANSANIILIYSGLSINAAQEYNSANGWTREHVWAKSRGDFGTANGPGTDCHHLRPENDNVNSTRSNRFFDDGGKSVIYNGVATGCFLGTTQATFEPRDAVKGDVARMIFYMAVRYEGQNGEPDLEMTDNILADSDKSALMGVKSTLLRWTKLDPVDDFERNRNEVVYSFQHNRNPFIDHPEYAAQIWETATAVGNDLSLRDYAAVVNAQSKTCTITAPVGIQFVEVYSLTGQQVLHEAFNGDTQAILNISNLKQGIYIIQINHQKALKIVVN